MNGVCLNPQIGIDGNTPGNIQLNNGFMAIVDHQMGDYAEQRVRQGSQTY